MGVGTRTVSTGSRSNGAGAFSKVGYFNFLCRANFPQLFHLVVQKLRCPLCDMEPSFTPLAARKLEV